MNKINDRIQYIITIFGLIGVAIALGVAHFYQFVYHEIPCPLCYLQRVGFINIALALLLNFRYKPRTAHWAMVGLSALTGAIVSIRQILLHIKTPEGFGSKLLGLHLYSWCLIGFFITLLGSLLVILIFSNKKVTIEQKH